MREALATETWLGFQIQGTGSNRLSIFLSILFPEPPNSEGDGGGLNPPQTTPLYS